MIKLKTILNEINLKEDETISASEAAAMIESSKSIFTVTFIKNDGSIRVLNGRVGVKKHLSGGSLRYDPREKDLIPIHDIQIGGPQGYRMLNKNRIISLKINGKTYNIEKEKPKELDEIEIATETNKDLFNLIKNIWNNSQINHVSRIKVAKLLRDNGFEGSIPVGIKKWVDALSLNKVHHMYNIFSKFNNKLDEIEIHAVSVDKVKKLWHELVQDQYSLEELWKLLQKYGLHEHSSIKIDDFIEHLHPGNLKLFYNDLKALEEKHKQKINPEYWQQVLNQSRLRPANRKKIQQVIDSIKKSKNLASRKQFSILQQFKSGYYD